MSKKNQKMTSLKPGSFNYIRFDETVKLKLDLAAAQKEIERLKAFNKEITEAKDLLVDKLAEFTTGKEINGGEWVLINKLEPENAQLRALLKECERALIKVCKRNDIVDAVEDYYGDCAMVLEKLKRLRGE